MAGCTRFARFLLLTLLLAWGGGCARESGASEPLPEDAQVRTLFQSHEAGDAAPFGIWNPASPPRSREFDFLIGRFSCQDQLLTADGSWSSSEAEWSAAYVLNGWAVQDWYWNERFAGTSIRTFDPNQDAWLVDFVGMPGVVTGRWLGQPEGGDMVMRQDRLDPSGQLLVSRLTFSAITPTSFSWVGEEVRGEDVRATWRIDCVRAEDGTP